MQNARKKRPVRRDTYWSISIQPPPSLSLPSFYNGTCNPFQPASSSCQLGNLATYSISATRIDDIGAGIQFSAREQHSVGDREHLSGVSDILRSPVRVSPPRRDTFFVQKLLSSSSDVAQPGCRLSICLSLPILTHFCTYLGQKPGQGRAQHLNARP
jgi:hypothetical protein